MAQPRRLLRCRFGWEISAVRLVEGVLANTFVGLLALGLLGGWKERLPVSTQKFDWPSLADYPCTAGRAATEADVRWVGRPLPVALPQYAFHVDRETGQRTPCIVVQAEAASGYELVGSRRVSDGQELLGLRNEFELLGTTPPGRN